MCILYALYELTTSALRVLFFCNFGCWLKLRKFKPSYPRHQSSALRSAIDAHMTPCFLPKSNSLLSAAADVIHFFKTLLAEEQN